jgi:hypothetical protein
MRAAQHHTTEDDERIQLALRELQDLICRRWPEASFRIARGADDPRMVHLWVTLDVDDTDEVVDAVMDRLIELQVKEGLPLAVIPVRPLERALEEQRRRHAAEPWVAAPMEPSRAPAGAG